MTTDFRVATTAASQVPARVESARRRLAPRARESIVVAAAVGASMLLAPPSPAQTVADAKPPAPVQKDFRPGLADIMLNNIQPRHAKLGLAGAAGNWPLAQFAIDELKHALTKAGEHTPRWRRGFPIPETTNALLAEPVEKLEVAIKGKDAGAFAKQYGEVTAGCNACHNAAGIGFIVIKTPDASAFPNQEFAPK